MKNIGRITSIIKALKYKTGGSNTQASLLNNTTYVKVTVGDTDINVTAKIYQTPNIIKEVKVGALVSLSQQDSDEVLVAIPIETYSPSSGNGVLIGDIIGGVFIQIKGSDVIIDPIGKCQNITINSTSSLTINTQIAEINANQVSINSPEVTCSGNITAQTGTIGGNILAGGMVNAIKVETHVHVSSFPGVNTSGPANV